MAQSVKAHYISAWMGLTCWFQIWIVPVLAMAGSSVGWHAVGSSIAQGWEGFIRLGRQWLIIYYRPSLVHRDACKSASGAAHKMSSPDVSHGLTFKLQLTAFFGGEHIFAHPCVAAMSSVMIWLGTPNLRERGEGNIKKITQWPNSAPAHSKKSV